LDRSSPLEQSLGFQLALAWFLRIWFSKSKSVACHPDTLLNQYRSLLSTCSTIFQTVRGWIPSESAISFVVSPAALRQITS